MSDIVGAGKGPDKLRRTSRFVRVVWRWIPAWWTWENNAQSRKPGQCCSAYAGKVLGLGVRLGVDGWTDRESPTGVAYTACVCICDDEVFSDPRRYPTRESGQEAAERLLYTVFEEFQQLSVKTATCLVKKAKQAEKGKHER